MIPTSSRLLRIRETLRRGKSDFSLNVLKLVSGAALAGAIPIALAPILTRLYHPDAFGVSALFLGLVSIIHTIASWGYDASVILPEGDEEAFALLGVSLGLNFLTSLLLAPVIWLWGEPLAALINAPPEFANYLWLMPLGVLASSLYTTLSYWSARTRRFGNLSKARVSGASAGGAYQLGFGFAGLATAGSLIAAAVFNFFVGVLVVGVPVLRRDLPRLKGGLRLPVLRSVIWRYRKFPQFDAGARFLNNLSWQIPPFILILFFPPAVVGYYTLGNRLLRAPMELIGYSIGQVFAQSSAAARLDGSLPRHVEATFRQLLTFSLFPLLVLAISGPEIFAVAFGELWTEAGVYAQILSLWTVFWFISSPLAVVFRVLERQEVDLWLNAAIFVTRVLSLAIGGWLGDARLAIGLFSATGVLVYGSLSLSVLRISGASLKTVGLILLKELAIFLPFGLVLAGLKLSGVHPAWQAGAAALFAGLFLAFRGLSYLRPKVTPPL
jgi:lipopolysaccharide exporter